MLDEGGVAGRLRARRNVLGLTQAELAERAGISERAVSDIERGLRRVVYRETTRRLVAALELSDSEAAEFVAAARGRPLPSEDLPSPATLSTPTLPRTRLIGRTDEMETIAGLVADPDVRLVTLVGPGGVGKTRIALELGSMLADQFDGGVVFVSLGNLRDVELVLPAIAGALKVRDGSIAALGEHLRGRRVLLILDTVEHLLGVAPSLAELVATTDTCKLIVTSRAPLNVRAEHLFEVVPLPGPQAVEMFLTCMEAAQPSSPQARTGDALAADICRRLDGLPLAIELAAARVRLLTPTELREHLDHRLQVLVGGPVDLPQRQRSMEATVSWSYDLLPSDARRLIEQLSIFWGGWSLESAKHVCEPADTLVVSLGQLVDFSLVMREAQGAEAARYRMLDTVREYAAERHAARVGRAGVHAHERRHADYFRALAEEAEPRLRGIGHRDWTLRLIAEQDNLRAVLSWAIAHDEAEVALRTAGALWMFWRLTGAFSEGRTWMDKVLAMRAGDHEAVRAKVLWGAGWLVYQQGDYEETARRGAELTVWARTAGDTTAIRNGVTLLGMERLAAGDFEGATRHFEAALEIARKGDSKWLLATSYLNRSNAAQHQGDLVTAHRLLNEAESLYRDLGDERFVAKVWLQRGYLALLESDVAGARLVIADGLAAASQMDDRWGVAEQLDGLAAVLAAGDDWRAAATVAGAAEATWKSIGAAPLPADRASTDRWLVPALREAGSAAASARSDGQKLSIEEAIAYALGVSRTQS
jgi:predicted ATPase/transcriptional regulator with XRE-family HTH domain